MRRCMGCVQTDCDVLLPTTWWGLTRAGMHMMAFTACHTWIMVKMSAPPPMRMHTCNLNGTHAPHTTLFPSMRCRSPRCPPHVPSHPPSRWNRPTWALPGDGMWSLRKEWHGPPELQHGPCSIGCHPPPGLSARQSGAQEEMHLAAKEEQCKIMLIFLFFFKFIA